MSRRHRNLTPYERALNTLAALDFASVVFIYASLAGMALAAFDVIGIALVPVFAYYLTVGVAGTIGAQAAHDMLTQDAEASL